MLRKVRGYTSRVFRYAVGMGIIDRDPTRDIPKEIFQKERIKHYATTFTEPFLSGLLKAIDGYPGELSVMQALKIAPFLFLRPTELTAMKWQEVDLDNRVIRIGPERMKTSRPHVVPLATQVFDMLMHSKRSAPPNNPWGFPSQVANSRPITSNSLRVGLRRTGITKEELTTHGLRHLASTLLNEQGYNPDAIELQLAHQSSFWSTDTK